LRLQIYDNIILIPIKK